MHYEIEIRNSKARSIAAVILVGIGVVTGGGLFFEDWQSAGIRAILFLAFWEFLFLVLFIYLVKELYQRKIQIGISRDGIFFRNGGLYSWDLIKSFSTKEDHEGNVNLVLHFEKYADEEFGISSLETEKERIIELMLIYKGASSAYYAGHIKK